MKPHDVTQQKIESIEERNARVSAEKAWEVSSTRRALIAGGTYIIVAGYLYFLGVERFYLHALVPPCAYLISTLSLPLFKAFWLVRVYKDRL